MRAIDEGRVPTLLLPKGYDVLRTHTVYDTIVQWYTRTHTRMYTSVNHARSAVRERGKEILDILVRSPAGLLILRILTCCILKAGTYFHVIAA